MVSSQNIKILLATHKQTSFPKNEFYLPVQAGRALTNVDLGIQGDNIGEHISFKNETHCELTVLYWAWKNIACDIIGLCHYRRYIDCSDSLTMSPVRHVKTVDNVPPFSSIKVTRLLHQYDILLPALTLHRKSIAEEYMESHIKEDMDIATNVLGEMHPSYIKTWKRFLRGNAIHHYNMFITKKATFDVYMSWLTPIIDEIERRVKLSDYPYQRRTLAFLSERLMNLYFLHNEFKKCYLPVCFVGEELKHVPCHITPNVRWLSGLSCASTKFYHWGFWLSRLHQLIPYSVFGNLLSWIICFGLIAYSLPLFLFLRLLEKRI